MYDKLVVIAHFRCGNGVAEVTRIVLDKYEEMDAIQSGVLYEFKLNGFQQDVYLSIYFIAFVGADLGHLLDRIKGILVGTFAVKQGSYPERIFYVTVSILYIHGNDHLLCTGDHTVDGISFEAQNGLGAYIILFAGIKHSGQQEQKQNFLHKTNLH